jgi:hypothetical protein
MHDKGTAAPLEKEKKAGVVVRFFLHRYPFPLRFTMIQSVLLAHRPNASYMGYWPIDSWQGRRS